MSKPRELWIMYTPNGEMIQRDGESVKANKNSDFPMASEHYIEKSAYIKQVQVNRSLEALLKERHDMMVKLAEALNEIRSGKCAQKADGRQLLIHEAMALHAAKALKEYRGEK